MSSTLPIKKEYRTQQHMDLYCKAGGLLKYPGFIGQVGCRSSMPIFKMDEIWSAKFPNPLTGCGGGNRDKDPGCAVIAPDASHAGVVMIDNYTYLLNFDLM